MCKARKGDGKMHEYAKLFNSKAYYYYYCAKCPCRRIKYYTFNIKTFILKELGYPHELYT